MFITPHFWPRLGGVETHVARLSEVLHSRKWQVEVVTLQDDPTQVLREKTSYAVVKRIPLRSQVGRSSLWSWIKKYFQSISENAIIHVHDVGWWLLPILFFNKKNKFYITFHGWEGKYPVRWQAKLHRLLISLLVNGNIHVGSFIQNFYWDKPSAVVFGGVQLPVKTEIQPIATPLNIVFLGRLETENNIEKYIEVLSKLAQSNVVVKMTWVGDGKFRHICEKWGRVTGMVDDVRSYTKDAHLIFASSYLSMLESQAQGKVICALYDNPLKKMYLESYPGSDTVILESSAALVAERIMELLENQDKYRYLSKKSAAFAQTQTWNLVADRYEQLWGER